MHLLVLSAFRLQRFSCVTTWPQVSMHLLVLSAFRLTNTRLRNTRTGLNAPFGAQCFPTVDQGLIERFPGCLNAPFGAQCFPTSPRTRPAGVSPSVSMHLLVLSAFRRGNDWIGFDLDPQSQCTFWCSVLSDLQDAVEGGELDDASQCTFWCSVLSDLRNPY